MKLPDEIIVFGDGIEADTLQEVLKFWVAECHRYNYAVAHKGQVGAHEYRQFNRDLRASALIIALSTGSSPAKKLIPLIYRLRTHLLWVGAFIAVVSNEQEAEQLNSSSLVGGINRELLFFNVSGHASTLRPLSLIDLFKAVTMAGEMHRYKWFGLLDRAAAPRLETALRDAEDSLQSGDREAAIAAVVEVLDLVRILDWQSLLDAPYKHWGIHFVSELLGQYPQNIQMTMRGCLRVVEKVNQLVRRSCVGGSA